MLDLLNMLPLVFPLVFVGGFVDSVAGGGGLITLPAYMMAGVPVHFAAGTNKVVNGCGSATASVKFFRSGKIRLHAALCAALGALLGGYIGAEIAKMLSEGLLKGLMLVALPLVAIFLAVKKDFGQETGEKQYPRPYEMGVSLGIGLVIGCYDGMVGPGTGDVYDYGLYRFVADGYGDGLRVLQGGNSGLQRGGGDFFYHRREGAVGTGGPGGGVQYAGQLVRGALRHPGRRETNQEHDFRCTWDAVY